MAQPSLVDCALSYRPCFEPQLPLTCTLNPCGIALMCLQWYEEAFEELKTVSNIDDLDRLVAVFMKQEDEHFSLFNYIQTVNQETDQHLEKTEELEVYLQRAFKIWYRIFHKMVKGSALQPK